MFEQFPLPLDYNLILIVGLVCGVIQILFVNAYDWSLFGAQLLALGWASLVAPIQTAVRLYAWYLAAFKGLSVEHCDHGGAVQGSADSQVLLCARARVERSLSFGCALVLGHQDAFSL